MSPLPNFKNRSVDASQHAMVPRADVPRSSFRITSSCKTAFDCGVLVPIYCDEVLPGDSHRVRMTAFCRLGTVLFPIMDNLHLETFFFFVPNRLIWNNWVKMMGERDSPADSISYVLPTISSPVGGWAIGSVADYFGLPTVGQVDAAAQVTTTVLPIRAYHMIVNEWFRDQNLQLGVIEEKGDGPDSFTYAASPPRARCKRPDYFTTCLPWPQKPTTNFDPFSMYTGVTSPYRGAGGADFAQVGVPVTGIGMVPGTAPTVGPLTVQEGADLSGIDYARYWAVETPGLFKVRAQTLDRPDIKVTINAIREAFQIQKLMERDARGGTRYGELVRSHFGVISPDARLQRPEYLGGGSSPVTVSPIAQQSATGQTGSTTPLGHLSATASGVVQGHRFSGSFTEHGWIIGIASVRADLNYYHGVHKMWFRSTRYDFYWPAFANLGEQAVLNRELFMNGVSVNDTAVFGFQERWAEYRSKPGIITGRFRGNAAGTLDAWHLAERFGSHPGLNATFIADPSAAVVRRVLAAGAAADGQQVLFDAFYELQRVRPIPTFSTPGFVDHF